MLIKADTICKLYIYIFALIRLFISDETNLRLSEGVVQTMRSDNLKLPYIVLSL